MKTYSNFGIYDFSDFAEELDEEMLFTVNGGTNYGQCGGGASAPSYNPNPQPQPTPSCQPDTPTQTTATSTPTRNYGDCGGFVPKSEQERSGAGYPKPSPSYLINQSIKDNNDKKYNFNNNGYECDNWVEEVLTDAGFDAGDYLTAGDSSKMVSEHIAALTAKDSGKDYSMKIPQKEGVYVVFMDGEGSAGVLRPHCGILTIGCDNVMRFTHNSSANSNNGVETWIVEAQNNGTKLSNLAYKNFYFQEVKR